jgi:protoporphyrinogen/coproporphyrinogen III oxidase
MVTNDVDVAVVGGGISGLTAARALCAAGLRVRLFEREPVCGGVIRTERIGGWIIDAGPDTLLTHKPSALELVRELGLDGSLVAPLSCRTTYVLRGRRLRTLPETSAMGLPTNWKTLVSARAFSLRGKIRMAAEPLLPAAPPSGDESIGAFIGRRFGQEAVTYVAEPVLAGLHRGDVTKLSMRALFPLLASAEVTHGSVYHAWRKAASRPGGPGSMSLKRGMADLVAGLHGQLPDGVAHTRTGVAAIERHGSFTLRLDDGSSLTARAVLLATPAYVTARLTGALDRELSDLCGAIRYAPSVNVALGYRRDAIAHPLKGWGFVVPRKERRHVRSASWVTSKWPGRAPDGHVLLRVSLADSPGAVAVEQSDDTLARWAHEDLRTLLGISAEPLLERVYRHERAMPQLEVGHLDRMAAIDERTGQLPGLFISASGFRGVGLPNCISDARAVAAQAAAYVAST